MSPRFLDLSAIMMRTFKEPGENRWFRHDGPIEGEVVRVQFHAAYAEMDAGGLKVSAAEPTAWMNVSDGVAIAPARAADPNQLVDNRDTFTIAGQSYTVNGCEYDGFGQVKVTLLKGRG